LGFKGDQTSISKTGVQSGAVVEGFDVVEDSGAGFGEGGEAMMVDDFVFKAAPEGFDEGVIVAVASAAHRSNQPMLSKELPVSSAGELGAAIGVNDRWEVPQQGTLGARSSKDLPFGHCRGPCVLEFVLERWLFTHHSPPMLF